MNSFLVSPKNFEAVQSPKEDGGDERAPVLEELERILTSRYFKSADRSKQFLRFVVFNKLDGRTERLKERTIGTEVFHRPPGYATGDDPVVRVQAGEVRRRLESITREAPQPSPVRLELPVGSYSPIFHWEPAPVAKESQTRVKCFRLCRRRHFTGKPPLRSLLCSRSQSSSFWALDTLFFAA